MRSRLGRHFMMAAFAASLIPAGAVSQEPDQVRTAHACSYGEWSEPRPLAGLPPGGLLRRTVIVRDGGRELVLGNNLTVDDGRSQPSQPLLAFDLEGRGIGKPAGSFRFVKPGAAFDSRGVLHLIWGEPLNATGADSMSWLPALGSVWYANYTEATGWSDPEVVVRATDELRWALDLAEVVVDSEDRIHAAVVDLGEPRALIHVVRTPGVGWRSTRLVSETSTYSGYTSLAVGEGGHVYLAYIGPDRSPARPRRSDANSLFLLRSVDGGRSWVPPLLISRSGNRQATSVRALVSPDGAIHLVWGQNLTGGIVAQVIRHSVSHDGGHTWSSPDDLDTPDFFRGDLRATVDRCGAVHIVYHNLEDHPNPESPRGLMLAELWYARWDSEWSVHERLYPHLFSMETDVAVTGTGLRLVWSARPADDIGLAPNFVPQTAELDINLFPGRQPARRPHHHTVRLPHALQPTEEP